MTQRTNDNFDWTRLSGATDTGNSGPDGAAQGSYYIYTEMSSPRVTGDVAVWVWSAFTHYYQLGSSVIVPLPMNGDPYSNRIETPGLQYSGDICISFFYHVYGRTIGSFYVTASSDSNTRLLEVTSDLGNNWNTATIDAKIQNGDKVIFLECFGMQSFYIFP